MRNTLGTFATAAVSASALASLARADFVLYANPTNWANNAGGTPVQANLFNYLGFPFPTQQIPNNIFGDLGVTMSSSVTLVAHMQSSGSSWYISTDAQGTQIEILFSAPQSAIYLTSAVKTVAGAFLQDMSTKSFYSGNTLLGSTTANSMGAISSTPIDRLVVTVNNLDYIPVIGPTFYLVPGPGALGILLFAPLGTRRRTRRR
jgi:hypothetical protein